MAPPIVFFTNRKTSPWPSQIFAGKSSVLLTAINHPLFMTEENRQAAEQMYPEIGALFRVANESLRRIRGLPERHDETSSVRPEHMKVHHPHTATKANPATAPNLKH
jgi:hypothetical protein